MLSQLRSLVPRAVPRVAPRVVARSAPKTIAKSAMRRAYTQKYSKSHEWVRVSNGVGTVGITAHAADALGEVVFVDLPSVGKAVKAGSAFGAVESVKAASDLYSPVSGEVVEVNKTLSDAPNTVNESPLADGWIMKVKLSNPAEVDTLLDEAAYGKHAADSSH